MADLAASNVTVTVVDKHGTYGANDKATGERYEWIAGRLRHVLVKIEFGDGALTYPANGVPMPNAADFSGTNRNPPWEKFGMVRELVALDIFDLGGSALSFYYDRTNKTIRMWNAGAELVAATDAPPAQTLYAVAIGW